MPIKEYLPDQCGVGGSLRRAPGCAARQTNTGFRRTRPSRRRRRSAVHACAEVTPACSQYSPRSRRRGGGRRRRRDTVSSKWCSAFSTRSTAPGAVAHLLAPDCRRMRPPLGRPPYCPSPFAPTPRPGNDHPVMALRYRSSPLTARLKGAPLPVRTTTCGATLSRRATYRTPHFRVQWAKEMTGLVR